LVPFSDASSKREVALVRRDRASYRVSVALAVNFTRSSEYRTSGAADCSASLWYFNGHKNITLATLSFHVNA
jgi:hypothetical protein